MPSAGDSFCNIVKTIDKASLKEYNYTYDEGNLISAVEYDVTIENDVVTSKTRVVSVVYVYNHEGELVKKKTIYPDGSESGNIPTRIDDEAIDSSQFYVTADDLAVDVITTTDTDELGRRTSDSVGKTAGDIVRSFTYVEGLDPTELGGYNEYVLSQNEVDLAKQKYKPTTQLVKDITVTDNKGDQIHTFYYEYDGEERIKKLVETYTVNGEAVTDTTLYSYDDLGQLLTETKNGTVINSMTYDGYGNILTKNGTAYRYGDNVWRDMLTAIGSSSIDYDAQGNPTTYRGKSLVWEKGRQLKSYGANSYTYNANGIRTSKTVDGVKHTYILDGTKILKETWGENTLIPLYDNEDSVCGICYNGDTYYFVKNLQGDVVSLITKVKKEEDEEAKYTVVARYSYDAWGKCTIVFDSTDVSIATINPYRYRGYYYDVETGLYYVSSRYYDPEIGRFLNSDDVDYLGLGGIISNNLFVYCENNAVNNSDPDGYAPFLGWGVQLEGSFMGISGGIELVWYRSIAKSLYGNRNLPCVYGYGGFSYNFKGGNVWNIKSLIKYVKDTALRAFGGAKKAAWKIGGSLSLCAFLVYGTINHPKKYTGPFITTGATLFHIKAYYSRSPKGDVYCWGLGISSSKFGFSPLSVSGYAMVPASVIISIANWFSSLFGKIKEITNLI